ncbi:unnamed protein product [Ixodes hexagonus]
MLFSFSPKLKQQAKKVHELDSLSFDIFHWIIRKSASLLPSIQHFSIQQYKDLLKFSRQIALLAAYRPSAPEYAELKVSLYSKFSKGGVIPLYTVCCQRFAIKFNIVIIVFTTKRLIVFAAEHPADSFVGRNSLCCSLMRPNHNLFSVAASL